MFLKHVLSSLWLVCLLDCGSPLRSQLLKLSPPGNFFSIVGERVEASGVAWVEGTDYVILADDDRPGQILLMRLDESGRQSGSLIHLDLGASALDPEGLTFGAGYFYLVGSQSDPSAGRQNACLRFAFDKSSNRIRGRTEAITDLRSFLLREVPELKEIGDKPGSKDGLNIEGISWDPVNKRLLLGLRSPLSKDRALIVPLKFKDSLGPFAIENLELPDPHLIRLNLGGHGIRDLSYNSQLKTFLILSGATELRSKTAFGLWEWNGDYDQSTAEAHPRHETALDKHAKPEGVTQVTIGGRSFVFIVGDSGQYLKIDYTSGN
jgi:uncharacterized protein DUF3616